MQTYCRMLPGCGRDAHEKRLAKLHSNKIKSTDELNFTSIIHHNLLTSMVQVIKAMHKLNISLHHPTNQVYDPILEHLPSTYK